MSAKDPLLPRAEVATAPRPRGKPRLVSLDVFRGLTVAWMVFVDDAGSSFPLIDHSPWDGVALADFVMPNFDFIVGVACAFSLKRAAQSADNRAKWTATTKATVRTIRLFVLGILTQCGVGLMQYQLSHIRIMGILQRVACCYYCAAIFEIWLTPLDMDPPPCHIQDEAGDGEDDGRAEEAKTESNFWQSLFSELDVMIWLVKQYKWQYLGVLLLVSTHLGIMYGVDVPPWTEWDGTKHICGRGKLTPPCNVGTLPSHLPWPP